MKQIGLKFQADRMVREFRRTARGMYGYSTEFKNQGEPAYRAPWYRALRWEVAISWFCMISVCLCLWYFGIVIVGPYGMKILFGK